MKEKAREIEAEEMEERREVAITSRELPTRPDKPICSSITDGEWTLHYRGADLPAELYNIAADPHEEHNLYTERRDEAERLHAAHIEVLKAAGAEESRIKLRSALPK